MCTLPPCLTRALLSNMAEESEVMKEVESTEKDSESQEETKEQTNNDEVETKEEVGPEEKSEEAPKVEENGKSEEEPTTQDTTEKTAEVEPVNEKEQEAQKESVDGHGKTVAKHYNEHPENTREERKGSRIFYLRNFNNWVKSVLINETIEKLRAKLSGNLSVLDMCCGKGGDLLKWQKGKVGNLVCADIADVSMKQCEQRFKDMQRNRHSRKYLEPLFDIQFITADCSKELLSDQYNSRNQSERFDMTSCQFAFHYAFETQEQAERMLQNACEHLKPGGYFIGTMPCAYELVRRLKESDNLSFGNDVYTVTFNEKENIALFGHKYDFHLDSVVDCPEFLVNFSLLEKMAEKYDMTLEVAKNFQDYYAENLEKYKVLLYRMQGLETYPPRRDYDKLSGDNEQAYIAAKDFLDGVKAAEPEDPSNKYRDHRNKTGNYVGTLSNDEWEAAGIYMVFAFKKKGGGEEKMDEEEWVTQDEALGDEDKAEENVGGIKQEKTEELVKTEDVAREDVKTEKSEEAEIKKEETDEKTEVKSEETEEKMEEETKEKTEEETKEKTEEETKEKTEEETKEKTEEVAVKEENDEAVDEKEEEEIKQEDDEEPKKTLTRRGRRSAGSSSSADETKLEEGKGKRETRKRKSTGNSSVSGEEEPPEKKKA